MSARLLLDRDLRLRPWTEADAPAIAALIDGDDAIALWLDLIPQPYTAADAGQWLRGEIGRGAGEVTWALDVDGVVTGSIGATPQDDDVWEVGYWIRREARGRGLMSRALVLVARWLLAERGAQRIFLRADPENVPSCRVAEKAGFTREGVLRSAHWNARQERRQSWTVYSLLPDDYAVSLYDHTVGDLSRQLVRGHIELCEPDPEWPVLFAREAERLRSVLGEQIVLLEHVGSTSVPHLPAKPIVDIVMELPATTDEAAYVPALRTAGYELRVREPDWFEHRLFKGPDTNINLHVFPAGCEETQRMLRFRDHLRTHDADRELYARTKRELAARDWQFVQQYADAKGAVVADIASRAY